jgi:Domain of unknown function (DUF4062)
MATPLKKLRIMISSRNLDLIPGNKSSLPLATVRKELQDELQNEQFLNRQLVEVWINEEAGAEDGSSDAWDRCMEQVDQADVLISIYNGNAGWVRNVANIGICHAELQRAYDIHPSKVWSIRLDFPSDSKTGVISPIQIADSSPANRAFANYLGIANPFRGQASDSDTLKVQVKLAVVKALLNLATAGAQSGLKGRGYLGQPLDWSRFTYQERKDRLESTIGNYLKKSMNARTKGKAFIVQFGTELVLLGIHAVPASFAISEAREMVGRPYLHDHESPAADHSTKMVGPIHIIACHKSCSESQVISFIGHPDLFIVNAPFGIFVADQVSFVQAFFITGCVDETATVVGLQRMFDWIGQSGEQSRLMLRARSRQRILATIAAEISDTVRTRHRP